MPFSLGRVGNGVWSKRMSSFSNSSPARANFHVLLRQFQFKYLVHLMAANVSDKRTGLFVVLNPSDVLPPEPSRACMESYSWASLPKLLFHSLFRFYADGKCEPHSTYSGMQWWYVQQRVAVESEGVHAANSIAYRWDCFLNEIVDCGTYVCEFHQWNQYSTVIWTRMRLRASALAIELL